MVSCLILYHTTITSLTKCKVLRAMFHEEDFEIHVIGKRTVVMYLWNVDNISVWQAALSFESTNIITGYGFGEYKAEAEERAWDIILTRFTLKEQQLASPSIARIQDRLSK